MANKRRKRSNFIVQGTILAVAGLIVRIIGLIYRIPLTNIIGDEGMGYYSFAYEPYSVMLLLSYHGLPTAVSKLVAEYNGTGRYRNSYRVFRTGMVISLTIGALTGMFLWFGSDFIAGTLNKQPMSTYALKVLGPTLFILSIMGILRGYFQGMGTMIPTAISQILEAIANAVVSIVAAAYLFDAGRTFDLVTGSVSRAQAYGAAGGTLGTCVGALAALLFLLLVFLVFKTVIKRQIRKDRNKEVKTYQSISLSLFFIATPIILSSIIYNIGTTLDGMLFSTIMQKGFQMPEETVAAFWGVFTNKYKIMIMIPVAISTALATSIVPDFSEEMAIGNKGRVATKIHYAIRFSMILAIPCAVGLTVLAEPVLTFLFHSAAKTDVNLLRYGSVAAVVYSLSTVSNAILQGINQMKKPVIHAAISLVIHLALLAFLVGVLRMGIYGVMISYVVFAVVICVLNARVIQKTLVYRQELKKTLVLPLICSAIMGLAVFAAYGAIASATKNTLIGIVLSVFIGVLVYMVLLLLSKGIEEEDLYTFPMGSRIIAAAKALRIMK